MQILLSGSPLLSLTQISAAKSSSYPDGLPKGFCAAWAFGFEVLLITSSSDIDARIMPLVQSQVTKGLVDDRDYVEKCDGFDFAGLVFELYDGGSGQVNQLAKLFLAQVKGGASSSY